MGRRAPLRLLRALLVTATVVALAGAGHLLGGSALPSALVLLGLGAVVLVPVAWLAGRRLAPGRLLAVVGAAQLGLHEAFTALAAPPACSGHGHHAGPVVEPPRLPQAVPEAAHHDLAGSGPAMLGGHVLAAVLTTLVLSRAEAGLWWALEWLRPLVTVPAPPRRPPLVPRPAPPAPRDPVPTRRGARPDRERGPPAATAPWSPPGGNPGGSSTGSPSFPPFPAPRQVRRRR